jgi:hypothetical protein
MLLLHQGEVIEKQPSTNVYSSGPQVNQVIANIMYVV